MPTLNRLIAALLVPCLLSGTVPASAISVNFAHHTNGQSSNLTLNPFLQEALVAKAIGATQYVLGSAWDPIRKTSARVQRTLHSQRVKNLSVSVAIPAFAAALSYWVNGRSLGLETVAFAGFFQLMAFLLLWQGLDWVSEANERLLEENPHLHPVDRKTANLWHLALPFIAGHEAAHVFVAKRLGYPISEARYSAKNIYNPLSGTWENPLPLPGVRLRTTEIHPIHALVYAPIGWAFELSLLTIALGLIGGGLLADWDLPVQVVALSIGFTGLTMAGIKQYFMHEVMDPDDKSWRGWFTMFRDTADWQMIKDAWRNLPGSLRPPDNHVFLGIGRDEVAGLVVAIQTEHDLEAHLQEAKAGIERRGRPTRSGVKALERIRPDGSRVAVLYRVTTDPSGDVLGDITRQQAIRSWALQRADGDFGKVKAEIKEMFGFDDEFVNDPMQLVQMRWATGGAHSPLLSFTADPKLVKRLFRNSMDKQPILVEMEVPVELIANDLDDIQTGHLFVRSSKLAEESEYTSLVPSVPASYIHRVYLPAAHPSRNHSSSIAASRHGIENEVPARRIEQNGEVLEIMPRAQKEMEKLDAFAANRDYVAEILGFGLTQPAGPNVTRVVDFIAPNENKVFVIEALVNFIKIQGLENTVSDFSRALVWSDNLALGIQEDQLVLISNDPSLTRVLTDFEWPVLRTHIQRLTPLPVPETVKDIKAAIRKQGPMDLNTDWEMVVTGDQVDVGKKYYVRVEQREKELGASADYTMHHHPRLSMLVRIGEHKPHAEQQNMYEDLLEPSMGDLGYMNHHKVRWFEIRMLGIAGKMTSDSETTSAYYNMSHFNPLAEEIKTAIESLMLEGVPNNTAHQLLRDRIVPLFAELDAAHFDIRSALKYIFWPSYPDLRTQYSSEATLRDKILTIVFHEREPLAELKQVASEYTGEVQLVGTRLNFFKNTLPGAVSGLLFTQDWLGVLIGAIINHFVHEWGHVLEARRQGKSYRVSWFMGIPHKVTVADEIDEIVSTRIAAAGPMLGSLLGLLVGAVGLATGHPSLLASALTIIITNLIATLPFKNTDGKIIWKHRALFAKAA